MLNISRKEFESFVREGVEAIPERFRSRIKNVAFLVRAKPTAPQRKRHGLLRGETLLGLYEGIPHTARGEWYGGFALPDKITIFKKPIEEEALLLLEDRFSNNRHVYTIAKMTEEEEAKMFQSGVQKLVFDTVWHEVAHHFGLDEEKVEEREKQRRRPKAERV